MGRQSGLSIRSYATAVSTSTTADVADQAEQENAVQLEIEESERATIQTTLTSRPANTQRKYVGYQVEFVKWCTARKFRDRETVTGGKLHLFLTSEVIGRKSKKNSDKVVGGSTVCGYVNAIVDLYSQQVTLRTNSNPHPRTPAVKQLIKNVQAKTTETRKKNYEDRGIGSLLDGYSSTEQFRQICDAFFALDDLRGRTSFLLSHFGLLRGENVRELELADMFSQVLDGEGFQPCTALVLLIQHGKTNTFGKLQHVGYIRNKDVHICPVGAAALYLFELFHVKREPFPLFREAKDWYDIKLLRGRQRTNSITYQTHKKSYEAVFTHLGISFNKKNHINRQQGVRQLESADVDISQTRRHGRWGMDSCEGIYSAPLAREAMRALSGHPARSRLYYLARATVEPPLELQQLIFPSVEYSQKQISDGAWENNLAARGFLELLQYLRVVLLQDCAVLFDILPTHMRKHEIFGEAFHQFRTDALSRAATTENPVEMQLQVAMPLLSERISMQHTALMSRLDSRHAEILQMMKDTNANLTSLLNGQMAFRLIPIGRSEPASSVIGPTDNEPTVSMSTTSEVQLNADNDVPSYTMSRGISNVRELWTEWHQGLSNGPSIEQLENQYGRKWRLSSKESKYFSRRLCIIKYVRAMVAQGYSVDSALDKADSERGRKSIDAFSKYISSKKAY